MDDSNGVTGAFDDINAIAVVRVTLLHSPVPSKGSSVRC